MTDDETTNAGNTNDETTNDGIAQMTPLDRRSAVDDHPLLLEAGAPHPAASVTISVAPPRALLQVSAFARDIDAAAERLSQAIGVALPAPNRFTGDAAINVRATGPGIWQIAGNDQQVPSAADLRAQLEGVATVVDLGHARTVFVVSGRSARRTLAKHCGLDLDRSAFRPGMATNTRFNQLGMTLARIDSGDDESPTFELMVFRGYAVFVFEALVESAREFGVTLARL